ncbi:XdhC/CoxI family protein [Acetobacterium wieringae]|uniref:XdhC/CoxI family protein n=1 Tax=Acetobacterium wieringae TaxID=52694 RepID=UPI002B1EE7B9|nr:XdhC/CoxI family protein [Acetobacterium wieringae]
MVNPYQKLLNELENEKQVIMCTRGVTNPETTKRTIEKSVLRNGDLQTEQFDEKTRKTITAVIDQGLPKFNTTEEGAFVLYEPFYSEGRLIILGGGHIAKPLARYGADIGFKVTVVDDRPSFANAQRFPEASRVMCESFDSCFDRLQVKNTDYVVVVTRGHRHDAVCLRQAIAKNPEYLGMIGSKRRVKGLMTQFREDGFTDEQLARVYSPIGLRIGAVTPEEIAISIIAEIIQVKRMAHQPEKADRNNQTNHSDFDFEVIKNLAENDLDKRAIVTVISKKGSVPRGAGAKMIIWPDGRSLGSIGGGCSEGEVIVAARDLLREEGGFLTMHVDMTGEVAEDEGMACGGIMDVLIEVYP